MKSEKPPIVGGLRFWGVHIQADHADYPQNVAVRSSTVVLCGWGRGVGKIQSQIIRADWAGLARDAGATWGAAPSTKF